MKNYLNFKCPCIAPDYLKYFKKLYESRKQ